MRRLNNSFLKGLIESTKASTRSKIGLKPPRGSFALSSYDIVGDIAVVRVESSQEEARLIAEALMRRHGNVRTVLRQIGGISGDFRLRRFE